MKCESKVIMLNTQYFPKGWTVRVCGRLINSLIRKSGGCDLKQAALKGLLSTQPTMAYVVWRVLRNKYTRTRLHIQRNPVDAKVVSFSFMSVGAR